MRSRDHRQLQRDPLTAEQAAAEGAVAHEVEVLLELDRSFARPRSRSPTSGGRVSISAIPVSASATY